MFARSNSIQRDAVSLFPELEKALTATDWTNIWKASVLSPISINKLHHRKFTFQLNLVEQFDLCNVLGVYLKNFLQTRYGIAENFWFSVFIAKFLVFNWAFISTLNELSLQTFNKLIAETEILNSTILQHEKFESLKMFS